MAEHDNCATFFPFRFAFSCSNVFNVFETPKFTSTRRFPPYGLRPLFSLTLLCSCVSFSFKRFGKLLIFFFFPFLTLKKKTCLLIGFRRSQWIAARHQHYKSTSKVEPKKEKQNWVGFPVAGTSSVHALETIVFRRAKYFLKLKRISVEARFAVLTATFVTVQCGNRG